MDGHVLCSYAALDAIPSIRLRCGRLPELMEILRFEASVFCIGFKDPKKRESQLRRWNKEIDFEEVSYIVIYEGAQKSNLRAYSRQISIHLNFYGGADLISAEANELPEIDQEIAFLRFWFADHSYYGISTLLAGMDLLETFSNGLSDVSTTEDGSYRNMAWLIDLKDRQSFSQFTIRGVFERNYLSQTHLEQTVFEGISLKRWIEADHNRGVIRSIGGVNSIWSIQRENVSQISAQLERSSILTHIRFPVF